MHVRLPIVGPANMSTQTLFLSSPSATVCACQHCLHSTACLPARPPASMLLHGMHVPSTRTAAVRNTFDIRCQTQTMVSQIDYNSLSRTLHMSLSA